MHPERPQYGIDFGATSVIVENVNHGFFMVISL